jgi:hypothetical protein
MNDQYGNPIPDDLVVLSGENPQEMTELGLTLVDAADWYEVDGILLVSAKSVQYFLETDPIDCGVRLTPRSKVYAVDYCLHRWNEEDGFYHA